MEKRIREAVRYLGFGKNAADERTYEMIERSFRVLETEISPKSICRIFEIEHKGDNRTVIGNLTINSRSLERNLKDCDRAVLFGATLGSGADRLIARAGIRDMAEAVVLQACSAAWLEEYCDECQIKIGKEMEKEGRYLRPRFSPGYGDFDIRYQQPIMRMLDCAKTIGLTMTESYMMTPTKSVTAVIGAGLQKVGCPVEGCETCIKKDCLYRR